MSRRGSRFSNIDTGGAPLQVEETTVDQLSQDVNNANRGTQAGSEMLARSLHELGAGRSILIDRDGRIIAGNKTAEQAAGAGINDVTVVKTDGRRLVAVQRMDLDLELDPRARRLALADNRIGQQDLDWDLEILRQLEQGQPAALEGYFNPGELAQMLAAGQDIEPEFTSFQTAVKSTTAANDISVTFTFTGEDIERYKAAVRRHPKEYWTGLLCAALQQRDGG